MKPETSPQDPPSPAAPQKQARARKAMRDTPAPEAAQSILVQHGERQFEVFVKRSARARRYTLRLRNATQDLVLSMPQRGSLRAASDFAQRNAGWIAERVGRMADNAPFRAGESVPLRGIEHVIVQGEGLRGGVRSLCLDGRWTLLVHAEAAHVSRRVKDFLKQEARRDLAEAVARHCAKAGSRASSLTLKDTTSRWGSCSTRGALNFSWRLIMAPPFVLDYLAAHEVAHLSHMNHSDAFWALTRRLFPDMDRAEHWLKLHGPRLHRYGKD